MPEPAKMLRRSRFTLAPLYLAAGLVVGFLVLTQMIPAMNSVLNPRLEIKHERSDSWHKAVLRISDWACAHRSFCIMVVVIGVVAGFIAPLWFRSMRYFVWGMALVVFLIDVALVGGGYGNVLSGLLREANELTPIKAR